MKTQLYKPYTSKIKAIQNSQKGLSYFDGIITEKIDPVISLREIADMFSIKEIKAPTCGAHPDFKHLKLTGKTENHWIVSMFMDVKGSTNFHHKYDLEQIQEIIQTIVTASIDTIGLFGGHVQRMQYDGVFAYFGGKGKNKLEAIKNAINTATLFSQFIQHELEFNDPDIGNVYTRVGIDFGDNNDVMWCVFGTDSCYEITTNSLHTSLAVKMQSHAKNNGIVIGKNIKDHLTDLSKYMRLVEDKPYIFQNAKIGLYGQYSFAWEEYLSEKINDSKNKKEKISLLKEVSSYNNNKPYCF